MRTAILLGIVLLFATPIDATASDVSDGRCRLLTAELNQLRSDLRIRYLLCDVGWRRSTDMLRVRRLWHDLRPVTRALDAAGVCWRNVGEVVAWRSSSGTARHKARSFIAMWRRSAPHWAILSARRYERGGGSWRTGDGRSYAAYYVLDTC